MINDHTLTTELPPGYCPVPIDSDSGNAGLRICVLLRKKADDRSAKLVVVRHLPYGQSYLGCVMDKGGVIHDWVDISVQDPDSLGSSPEGIRTNISNADLDQRWIDVFRAQVDLDPEYLYQVGFEELHPSPAFVDPDKCVLVYPRETESGHQFGLCRDDSFLIKHGLPPYGGSLHRYLYVPELGEDTPFVATTRNAPQTSSTRAMPEVWGDYDGALPFNVGCGLIMVRRYSPITLDSYVEVLGGGSWSGVFQLDSELNLGNSLRALSQGSMTQRLADGQLVVARPGSSARILEILYLKLRLLADLVKAVREFVARTRKPILNLRSDSFQIRLGDEAPGLPFLWTSTARLVNPGQALPLPIIGSRFEYYLRTEEGASIYWPESGKVTAREQATVRLRKIEEVTNGIVAEGTLHTREMVRFARSDLLWLRIQLENNRVDLYAHAVEERTIAEGEIRFRTVPQSLREECCTELRRLEGIPLDGVPFEVVPLLSTPFDLYGLGVLMAQTLIVDREQRLPVALDGVLSLAGQMKLEFRDEESRASRVEQIVMREPKWLEQLGPHRLVREDLGHIEALDLIPPQLWFQVLALLVRMFPGVGPDSFCRDLGDAPPGGIHKVFDPILEELDDMLRRTRSLLVVDWAANREIHGVIRRYAAALH